MLPAAVVNVAVVWLFLAADLAAPDRVKAHLAKAKTWVDWVKAHSDLVIRTVLSIAGLFLVISGALGLSG